MKFNNFHLLICIILIALNFSCTEELKKYKNNKTEKGIDLLKLKKNESIGRDVDLFNFKIVNEYIDKSQIKYPCYKVYKDSMKFKVYFLQSKSQIVEILNFNFDKDINEYTHKLVIKAKGNDELFYSFLNKDSITMYMLNKRNINRNYGKFYFLKSIWIFYPNLSSKHYRYEYDDNFNLIDVKKERKIYDNYSIVENTTRKFNHKKEIEETSILNNIYMKRTDTVKSVFNYNSIFDVYNRW